MKRERVEEWLQERGRKRGRRERVRRVLEAGGAGLHARLCKEKSELEGGGKLE